MRSQAEGGKTGRLLPGALGLYGFFLPFSTAGISLTLAALLVLALAGWRGFITDRPWREPVMAVGLVLLAFIALHTLLFSGWTHATWGAVNHYHELLLAPLLLCLLAGGAARRAFFRGFVLGSVLLAAAFWVAQALPSLEPGIRSHRISAGFAVATAAFLLVMRVPRPSAGAQALAAALALTVALAMDGRTGQLILLLYAGCAGWRLAPPRWRWAAALALPVALAGLTLGSPAVRDRVAEMQAAWTRQTPPADGDSSGVRLELLRIATRAAATHPLAGSGYARYPEAHARAADEVYAAMPGGERMRQGIWMRGTNPHGEFLMQIIGGGAVGLALFLAWLLTGFQTARRAQGPPATALAGLVLGFAVGCLFNSWLLDFIEGHVFVALLALLVAEIRQDATQSRPQGPHA